MLINLQGSIYFNGLSGAFWKLRGIARSDKNPNLCTGCGLHWSANRVSEVTVLFADCRNYTGLTRELGAEKIAPMMDDFYRTTAEIVYNHHGIVDKFLGDACMALFNVPVRHDGHVEDAAQAAVALQQAVPSLNARWGDTARIQVGVGISTGWAFVGTVGSHNLKDYTAIGDVVNIASRLQGQAAPGQILLTQEAYDAVQTHYPNSKRLEYALKGIDEPVAGYLIA